MRTLAFWLSLILIFVIPWENVIQLEGVGTASRAVGLFVAAFWAFTVVITGRLRRLQPFHLVLFLFVLWNAATIFWSVDVDKTTDRILTYFQLAILVWILWDLYTTPAALRAALQAYVLGAYVSIGSSVYNYLAGTQYYIRRYAASGFNPNDLGLILALGIPMAWYLATAESNSKMDYALRIVNFAYLPAATLAIVLTGSRGSLIAASAAFFFVLMSLTRLGPFGRISIFAVVVAALFLLQGLVPQTSFERLATVGDSLAAGDLHGRVDIWREGLALFSEHPFLGIGSGAFRTAAIESDKVAHNVFVSVLVEVGIIGFILLAIILVITIYQALRQPRWLARLWLTILLVWGLGALVHTWEQRKQTWLVLSLVIVSAGIAFQRDESRLDSESPVKTIGLPMRETGEASDATLPARAAGNATRHNRRPFTPETGGDGQHFPYGRSRT